MVVALRGIGVPFTVPISPISPISNRTRVVFLFLVVRVWCNSRGRAYTLQGILGLFVCFGSVVTHHQIDRDPNNSNDGKPEEVVVVAEKTGKGREGRRRRSGSSRQGHIRRWIHVKRKTHKGKRRMKGVSGRIRVKKQCLSTRTHEYERIRYDYRGMMYNAI